MLSHARHLKKVPQTLSAHNGELEVSGQLRHSKELAIYDD